MHSSGIWRIPPPNVQDHLESQKQIVIFRIHIPHKFWFWKHFHRFFNLTSLPQPLFLSYDYLTLEGL